MPLTCLKKNYQLFLQNFNSLKNSFMAAYTVAEVKEQIKGYNYTVLQKLHNDNLSSYTVFTNTNT